MFVSIVSSGCPQDMSSRLLQDMSSRRLQGMSSRRLQDVFAKRLQDVSEDVELLRWTRVEDVLKTCLEDMSSRPAKFAGLLVEAASQKCSVKKKCS